MQSQLKLKYSGVTSLLVVLAIGMFLIVLVSGIAALSLREQQQTRNTEFSSRALQTAEAGVKVAVQKLSADPNYTKTGCAPGPDYENIIQDTSLNQEITCIEIKNSFSSYESDAENDKVKQLTIETPSTVKGPNSLQLRWHSKTLDQDKGTGQYALPVAGPFYPTVPQYDTGQYAASVEMTFIFWPRNTNFNGSDPTKQMQTATIFFTPGQNDQSQPFNGVTSRCQNQAPSIQNLDQYRCVTNPSSNTGFDLSSAVRIAAGTAQNYNFVVRIKPRYKDMHFQFTAFDVDGNPINTKSNTAQIDVTARTGDLYRRIKAEKVIVPATLEGLFDSVLYAGNGSNDNSDREICKNLVVRADGSLAPASSIVPCN